MCDMKERSDEIDSRPTQPQEKASEQAVERSPLEDFMGRLMTEVRFLADDTHRSSSLREDKVFLVTDNAKILFQSEEKRCIARTKYQYIRRQISDGIGVAKRHDRWSSQNELSPTSAGLTCPTRTSSFDVSVCLAPTFSKGQKVVMDYSNIPLPRIAHSRADQFFPIKKLGPDLAHLSCLSQRNHGLGL